MQNLFKQICLRRLLHRLLQLSRDAKKLRGSDLSYNCPEPRNLPCDCCIIETCEEVSLPHCTTVDSVVPLCSRMRALVEMTLTICELCREMMEPGVSRQPLQGTPGSTFACLLVFL